MVRKGLVALALFVGLGLALGARLGLFRIAHGHGQEYPQGATVLRGDVTGAATAEAGSEENSEAKLRALTPEHLIEEARRIGDGRGNPKRINILFSRADLDGTGKFDFIVALYNMAGAGGAVRVLRQVGGQLTVAGDQDSSILVGGGRPVLELVDVDNDGIPEVSVIGFGMQTHYTLNVFEWTGESLRLLTVQGATGTGDAGLEDTDDDGVLEIVRPPDCSGVKPTQPLSDCIGPYRVYKFNGTEFQLAFTSPVDPTGVISPTGENLEVFGDRALMNPETFPLALIRQALQKAQGEGGVVTVRLGNLSGAEQGARFDVKDIDSTSLILGRTIRPLRTQILPASAQEGGQGQAGGFRGDFLQAEFDRQVVLQFLPRTQLSKPLEAGDKLTLELRGKMKSGAPLHTSVQVELTGP